MRESGKPRDQIAEDLGVCKESLRRWKAAYDEEGRKRLSPEAIEHAEVERLKRELRGTYGSPRVHAELRMGRNIRCSSRRTRPRAL